MADTVTKILQIIIQASGASGVKANTDAIKSYITATVNETERLKAELATLSTAAGRTMLTEQNQLRQQLTAIRGTAEGSQDSVLKLANTIKGQLVGSIMGAATAYLSWHGAAKLMEFTVDNAAEEEAAWKRLSLAIDNTGADFDVIRPRIVNVLEDMRRLSAFSDNQMIAALQVLTDQTGDYDRALEILPHAMDLAAQKEMSLTEAATMLGKVTDENIMRMGRLFPRLKEEAEAFAKLHPEVEKGAYFLELVNKTTSGQAAAQLETYRGKVADLKDEFEELGEGVGKIVMPSLNDFLGWSEKANRGKKLSETLSDIADLIATDKMSAWQRFGVLISLTYPRGFAAAALAAEEYRKGLERIAKQSAAFEGKMLPAHAQPFGQYQPQRSQYDIDAGKAAIDAALKWKLAIERIYYDLGARTTEQMIAFYKAELAAFAGTEEMKKKLEGELNDLRLRLERETLEQIKSDADIIAAVTQHQVDRMIAEWKRLAREIKKAFKEQGLVGTPGEGGLSIRSPYYQPGPNTQPNLGSGGLGQGARGSNEEVVTAARAGMAGVKNAVIEGLKGLIDGLRPLMSEWVSQLADLVESALSMDLRGVVSSIVSLIVTPFIRARERERQRVEDQRRALEEFNRTIDANIAGIENLTQAEKGRLRAAIEAEIQRLRLEMQTQQLTGRERAAREEAMAGWMRELEALNESLADFSQTQGINNLADLQTYLHTSVDSYNKGRMVIDHFAQMMDLTNEQQLALYEELRRLLGGELSTAESFALDELIEGLQDQIEEDKKSKTGSQTYRSVTTITERQGNSIVEILNTISFNVRQIYEGIARGFSAAAAPGFAAYGGIIVQGDIIIRADSQDSGKMILDRIDAELRSRGR